MGLHLFRILFHFPHFLSGMSIVFGHSSKFIWRLLNLSFLIIFAKIIVQGLCYLIFKSSLMFIKYFFLSLEIDCLNVSRFHFSCSSKHSNFYSLNFYCFHCLMFLALLLSVLFEETFIFYFFIRCFFYFKDFDHSYWMSH